MKRFSLVSAAPLLAYAALVLTGCLNSSNKEAALAHGCTPSSRIFSRLETDTLSCTGSAVSDSLCLIEAITDTSTLSDGIRQTIRARAADTVEVRGIQIVSINWSALSWDTIYIKLAPNFTVKASRSSGSKIDSLGNSTWTGSIFANSQDPYPLTGRVRFDAQNFKMTSGSITIDSTRFYLNTSSSNGELHFLQETDLACMDPIG